MPICNECNKISQDENFYYKNRFLCFRCVNLLTGDMIRDFERARYEELMKKRATCVHDFTYDGYG